jgi:hypothetical protein
LSGEATLPGRIGDADLAATGALALPGGWIGESVRDGDVLRFAAAGVEPLDARPFFVATSPLAFRGAINEGLPLIFATEGYVAPPAKMLSVVAAPNPFNSKVMLRLTVPGTERVTVTIHNTTGQLVRTLLSDARATSVVGWDGKDQYGADVATGVYLYRVSTVSGSLVGKLVMLR